MIEEISIMLIFQKQFGLAEKMIKLEVDLLEELIGEMPLYEIMLVVY